MVAEFGGYFDFRFECGALVDYGWVFHGASHIMLFHHGDYLGTGTLNPIQGSPSVSRNSANQISASVGSSQATFTWDSAQEKIVMNGDLPTG